MPCDIRSKLDSQHEYIIVSCDPDISIPQNDDIKRLNDVLDEINSENPDMTAYYLGILLQASNGMSLFDDEFIRKAKENDFMFEELTDIKWRMEIDEIAACYLLQELGVPFDKDMSKDSIEHLKDEEIVDYINWKYIWEKYGDMGFKLVTSEDPADNRIFLVYWK